ncbi:MAG: hypothetical protein GYA33_00160 [Thermogutta sp.]|nr:hypothetical protein [Thermogutta sp.]
MAWEVILRCGETVLWCDRHAPEGTAWAIGGTVDGAAVEPSGPVYRSRKAAVAALLNCEAIRNRTAAAEADGMDDVRSLSDAN